ncbi:chloride channel protein [Paenibacillus hexagrammi]|uniref:Chloride channel protein n=1 Tax=Paenibacillus hexagrammi TaxID=2908839 RepID=A0ABY3SEE6_9BACL|nr:chloride channel protein [Paenibacillus sp. YPD9-1]UJF31435.1 chloride channel protein [Paenibacillus sp. YPD9-1]
MDSWKGRLSDFRFGPNNAIIAGIAVVVGAAGAGIAIILQNMIGFFTNLFYFHRFSFDFVSPYPNQFGWMNMLAPVIGGLIIGLMARYGSDKIRGHGIPEAMESILHGKSVVSPKLAMLKPISAAISIGSGGPFGAEGPIIMSGGSLGSVIGQFFNLTASERKVLLLCGAAAGMSATFHAPIASIFFAVELLAFELRPRSVIPIVIASVVSDYLRQYWIGDAAVFPSSVVPASHSEIIVVAVGLGVVGAALAYVLTKAIYGTEDLFDKINIHWMWWPAIGGVIIGIGGILQPEVLGVGYDSIRSFVTGQFPVQMLLSFLIIKSIIWIVALGSGTSGGIMAPLLLIGGASGEALAFLFHASDPAVWAIVGMAAVFSGVTRSPLTTSVFMLELTHDLALMLPILLSCAIATGISVIALPRSILTEKLARRGSHISRDYAVDPMERMTISQLESPSLVTFPQELTIAGAWKMMRQEPDKYGHKAYPILDASGKMIGEVCFKDLQLAAVEPEKYSLPLSHLACKEFRQVSMDQTIQRALQIMLESGRSRIYVVNQAGKPLSMLTRRSILDACRKNWEEEHFRERFLGLHPREKKLPHRLPSIAKQQVDQ